MRERAVLEHLQFYGAAAHTMLAQYQTDDGQVYCQYPYVSGETSIDGASYALSEQMGEAIGHLHNALKSYAGKREYPVRDMYDVTFSTVLNAIKMSQHESIMQLACLLMGLREEMLVLKRLPKQLIHRDAHGGNMIFHNGHFKGFIDFDLMEINVRLFDPCYSAMGILPNRFEEKEFKKQWVNFLGGIVRGYHRVSPLTLDEIRSIWFVVLAIEALFVALFIKSNPEIAAKNAQICLWLAEIRDEVEQLRWTNSD
jgi:Ser/Thr protein kinase RdoA (MazF antagonist)